MKKVNYYCDVCGKEFKDYNREKESLRLVVSREYNGVDHDKNVKVIDICHSCLISEVNTYFNKQGGGQIGVGVCFPKTV